MLKLKITKDAFEGLDESIKALYKTSGDGYALNVEPDPQISELAKQVRTLSTDLDKRKTFVDPSTIPDAEALTKQLNDERTGRQTDVQRYQSMIAKSLIAEKASEIAGKISKSPGIMKRFVSDALTVDFTGETPSVKVIGKDGKPADTSFDDLSKSLLENPDYADIVIGSKATGGAGVTKTQLPNSQNRQDGQTADLSKASASDIVSRVEARLAAKNGAQ